jgi:hypothetical protein
MSKETKKGLLLEYLSLYFGGIILGLLSFDWLLRRYGVVFTTKFYILSGSLIFVLNVPSLFIVHLITKKYIYKEKGKVVKVILISLIVISSLTTLYLYIYFSKSFYILFSDYVLLSIFLMLLWPKRVEK